MTVNNKFDLDLIFLYKVFDLLLSELRENVRVRRRQKAAASLGIMDSQSVRWGNNRSLNSFDAKK